MTYYKYAERDATSQVNWADVSKKWTDQINQVATDRDKKRADIQKATDELTDSIINAPMGENEGVNAWYSNFADQSSEYLLDANRRLKSGDLKVRDYNTIMANMTQGTERMTGLAKDYSDNYAIKMERLKNDDSQQAELAMMELAEGYANFTNTQGIVNPTNGMISIAKNDTGETITIPQMRAYINMQYDKYDVDAALDKQVARLASDKRVIMSGDVKTRESQLRAWNLAKDNLLDAELADGLHVSSILTEDVGGYNVVTDATKVGENDVLFVLDPSQPSAGYRVPLYGLDLSNMTEADLDMIFSADLDDTQRSALIKQAEEQKGVARDWLNTDFERRLGVIETPMAEPSSKSPSDSKEKGEASAKTGLNNLQAIYTAKEETKDNMIGAINYFEGLNPGLDLEVVNRNNTRTLAIKRDGEEDTRYVSMETDYPTFVESVTSFVMPKNQYLSSALDENPLPEGSTRGTALGGVTMERAVDVENIGAETVKYTNDKGKEVQQTFRAFIEGLAAPDTGVTSQLGNVDEDTIFTVNEVKSALDQLDLSDDIKVEAILENTLEDLYGRTWVGTSTIDYPGIQIQAPNMPNGIVISHESGEAASLGPVLELIATGKTVSIEELYDLMGEESIAITKELIENGHLNVEQPEIPNPNANTPEVDAFGNPI